MTQNQHAATALSLAAQIRARIETGIVPYIVQDAETIADLLEGLAAEIEALRGGGRGASRLPETHGSRLQGA